MNVGGLEFRLSCRGFGKFRLINFFVDREAIFFSGLQWFDVDYRFLAGLLGCSVFVLSPFQKRTPDSRLPTSRKFFTSLFRRSPKFLFTTFIY